MSPACFCLYGNGKRMYIAQKWKGGKQLSGNFKRDKSIYENYVCPNCFRQMDKCICDVYPHYYLIWIDKGIQDHIRILNEKGYSTEYSCESHKPKNIIYIVFDRNYSIGDNISIPEGFKYTKSKCKLEHRYDRKLSQEEFEAEKKRHLNILLEWCEKLPDLND